MKHCVVAYLYHRTVVRQLARGVAAMALVTALGGSLCGCAGIHLLGDTSASTSSPAASAAVDSVDMPAAGAITGAVSSNKPLDYDSSDHSDWDLIRSTVASSLASPSTAHIEWTNPATGNSGTVSDLAPSGTAKGRDCRSFASTIAAVDGVRLYHAEICKSVMNTWEFSKIAAADVQ